MSNKEKSQTLEITLTPESRASDAIDVLNEKLSNLKKIVDTPWKTNGKVTTAGGQKDIKEEKNELELIKSFASVLARIGQIENAYTALNITSYPVVKVDGGTKEEWTHDIDLQIQIIRQKDTFDTLTEIKKEWEALMDKEDRKALLIKKMKNL